MPVWLSAGLWGLVGASSLILGATIAFCFKMPRAVTAGIMSFGCGVLISAVAYDLVEDGFQEGGIWPIVAGAIAGSVSYAIADWLVSRNGAHHRKQSGTEQLLSGQGVSIAMFAAIFLSNLPEGLSSALGMRRAGRSATYIFGLWIGIAVLSGLAALAGAAFLGGASPQLLAAVNAVAAGALLTMVINTMIPEAVEGDHKATGVLGVLGLLVAFALSNLQD